MKKKITSLALCVLLLAFSVLAEAQEQAKVARIGELLFRPGATLGAGRELFRRLLRELGYVEGKNIAIESRFAGNKPDRLPPMVDELVRLKVDVIVAGGTNDARAARNITKTIPIVMAGLVSIRLRQAWWRALPVPAAMSPALQTLAPN